MRVIFLSIVLVFLLGCKREVKDVGQESEKVFQVYQLSPMSELMERLYAESLVYRNTAMGEGDEIVGDTDYLEKMKTAALTNTHDRDDFFEEHLVNFSVLYNKMREEKPLSKETYNAMVGSCLECHAIKCSGPVERIKKLIIR